MTKKVMEGSHAIAEAVKLCEPKVIAAYPITPQTHIVEGLSKMVADGQLDAEYITVESEHSAMAACIGAIATGVRTYTATASAGLALMNEMLGVASGMRLPIVMTVANRSLSAPLSIWNDWSDSMSARDMGWLQLYCQNAQEAYDTTIQAYKIAEKVELPVMVCIDGFYLSHTYEPVHLIKKLGKFLPKYKPKNYLDPKKPVTMGAYAGPEHFQEFREQQQIAMESALKVIEKTNEEFGKKFGRFYGNGLLEAHNLDKAKHAIITMGTLAGTVKHVIEKNKIKDMALIKLKSFRPFPAEQLKETLSHVESAGTLEKHICTGSGPNIWKEIETDTPVKGFVAGLSGRDITEKEILQVFKKIRKGEKDFEFVGSKL